mmetsp:Transcript_85953/g.152277  ORF Transcript_85953/g.152277 Transcript_85953/m.152277 type:complete len:384 (+) Transcript_85953:64-1215(+)
MSSLECVGLQIVESQGHFHIDNFRDTLAFKTITGKPWVKRNARDVNEITSGPILAVGTFKFHVRVSWCVKEGQRKTCNDSKLGIHLWTVLKMQETCVIKGQLELINVDGSCNACCEFGPMDMSGSHAIGWGPGNPAGAAQSFKGLTLDQVLNSDNGWLHNGKLKIHCKLSLMLGDQTSTAEATKPNTQLEVCNDLGALFASQAHTDVIFNVSGKEIRAHSQVLIARSPVFAAMFSLPMRESQGRHVSVEDLDGEAMNSMVQFLYSGNIKPELLTNDPLTIDIMKAAHRYQVNSLLTMCVQALSTRLNIETVCDWLQIADMIACSSFKTACLDFIRSHIADVQATESYGVLTSKCPALLAEILAMLFPPAKRQKTDEGKSTAES